MNYYAEYMDTFSVRGIDRESQFNQYVALKISQSKGRNKKTKIKYNENQGNKRGEVINQENQK